MLPIQRIVGQNLDLVHNNGLIHNNKEEQVALSGEDSFSYALEAAKKLIDTTRESENEVQNKTLDFMTGKNDNIVDLLVAQEKSSILLQYSLQVRNGVLNAYKEIMNLSI